MKGQTQLGVAPWVCSAHPSGAGSRSNKAVTSAWPSKTTLHPAGSRGRSVTSAPRWAVGTMQSVGRRAWTHGVSKRRADSGERVMGILVWDTNGASGENRQGGGFRGPPAVSRGGSLLPHPRTTSQSTRLHVHPPFWTVLSSSKEASETPEREYTFKREENLNMT